MSTSFLIPSIPPPEMTPTVELLFAIIEQQQVEHQQQAEHIEQLQVERKQLAEHIEQLEAELARLQKRPAKPKIKPSTVNDDDQKPPPPTGSGNKQRPGSQKRQKRPRIHRSVIIQPEAIPSGSRFLGYQDYVLQDLIIQPVNTRYRLARYRTPEGQYLKGQLPAHLQATHFGPTLQSYIRYQYHHQRVTQPLLLQQLREWHVDLSSGQLNRLLTEHNDRYHEEKQALLAAGLAHASYLHVDDTGARHGGKNGYCTHIGNEQFAYFESTESKSRVNFLQVLAGMNKDYVINATAIDYMNKQGLPAVPLQRLTAGSTRSSQAGAMPHVMDDSAWSSLLESINLSNTRHVRIATEGALIGSLIHHGFARELVIVSDDAGQFNVFRHALCWCHAERVFQRILPPNELNAEAREWVISQLWSLYQDLKAYKLNPTPKTKRAISVGFDNICQKKTQFQTLNEALKRLANNKSELLLVLDEPGIPLTNNLSERDIREYVIKRKISGSTRSEAGRKSRDTFASLKKTCKKQGISFWDYLMDRTTLAGDIPLLADLISGQVVLNE